MKLFSPFLKLPRWLLSVVCFGLIVYLTLVPKPLPDNDFRFWEHTDKLVHAIMFGAMYVCSYLDLWRGKRGKRSANCFLTLAVGVFGGVIELLQQTMHIGRSGSVGDFFADLAGIVLAAALMLWCTRTPQVQQRQ